MDNCEEEGRNMDLGSNLLQLLPQCKCPSLKSYPLKDESTFEKSPIFDLMLQNLDNQSFFLFLFKYKLKS